MKRTIQRRTLRRGWPWKGKGKDAKRSYAGHVLMENHSGLVVNARLTAATGTAERYAAVDLVDEIPGQKLVTYGCRIGRL